MAIRDSLRNKKPRQALSPQDSPPGPSKKPQKLFNCGTWVRRSQQDSEKQRENGAKSGRNGPGWARPRHACRGRTQLGPCRKSFGTWRINAKARRHWSAGRLAQRDGFICGNGGGGGNRTYNVRKTNDLQMCSPSRADAEQLHSSCSRSVESPPESAQQLPGTCPHNLSSSQAPPCAIYVQWKHAPSSTRVELERLVQLWGRLDTRARSAILALAEAAHPEPG